MRQLLLFSTILMFGTILINGQVKTVTGRITSSEDAQSLPGATVVIKGTTKGTVTDWDGNFSLEVGETDVLVISFVGMQTQELAVAGKQVFDVVLAPEALQVQEVVVTAMGIKREKRALGYAAQDLTGEKIVNSGQPDVAKALQGKIAGVTVRQSSGMPGASSRIQIRGSNSLLLSNQPLYVVDGMPIETETGNIYGATTSGPDVSSRSIDINPDDIESINILKGPAAAALYGLRASNGVIIITTKSGKIAEKAKQKTVVSVNSSVTANTISRVPELQNKYGQGTNGLLDQYSPYSWGPLIDSLKPYQSQLESVNPASKSIYDFPLEKQATNEPKVYDNVRDFFKTGYTYKNSVDISTATDLGNYSIGMGSTNMSGIIPTTGMDKYNAKFNGMFKVHEKVKIGASTNFSSERIDKVPSGNTTDNPLFTVYAAPRTYNLKEKPFEDPDNPYIQKHYRRLLDNPYWVLEHNQYFENTDRVFGNFSFDCAMFKWLNLNYKIGLDNFNTKNTRIVSLGSGSGRAYPEFGIDEPSEGYIDKLDHTYTGINSTFLASMNKTFKEDYRVDLILGNEIYDSRHHLLEGLGQGMQYGGAENIAATNDNSSYQSLYWKRGYAYFGTLTVDYKGLVYLTPTGRFDVVSNMPKGNRTFFYPSVSTGFVLTKLKPLENNKALSFGKVRLSYAMVGQAGDLYSTRRNYTPAALSSGMLSSAYLFPYNGVAAYTNNNVLYTDALRPQNTKTLEAGIDLRFFNNRIGIDYTYYIANAEDQIFRVPIARSSGYSTEYRNSGKIQTRGQELMLNLKPVQKDDYGWEFITNFTMYKSVVKALADGVERIEVGANFTSIGTFAYTGQQYPVLYGTSYMRDAEGNVVVDSRDSIGGMANPYFGMPLQGEQKVLGKVAPDFEIGFINNFNYKAFTLSVQVDWRKGGYQHSGLNALMNSYGMSKVTESREEDFVVEGKKGYVDESGNLVVEGNNDIAIKRNQAYYNDILFNISEADIYKTTFVRLREVMLMYDLPKKWMKNSFISTCSVFISGHNLWLWTEYPNFDPEVSTSSGNATGGFEYVALPNTKSYGGGVKLTF